MLTELTKLTISTAKEGLKNGNFSAKELVQAHIDLAEKAKDLNTFITPTFEKALKNAEATDEKRAKGEELGLMGGIPIANKDLLCTKGRRTTAGSKMLSNFVPAYDSTVAKNLENAGAICLGKLNLDEFAMGSGNLTSHFGTVKNPWRGVEDKDLVPGGSSGGSSAAVAAHICMGATATDTGGSIRQPAAFTGTVGIKPTYGRCSRYGIVAFASSLDQAGPITRNVRDAAIMLEAMAGFDSNDSTSSSIAIPKFENAITGDIRGLRVGIPQEYIRDGMQQEIIDAWHKGIDWLRQAGAEIIDISLPHTKYALPAYYVIAPAEASSNLARFDGVRYGNRIDGQTLDDLYMNTRAENFGDEVKRRIFIGTYVLSSGFYDAYYAKAQKVRRLIANDFIEAYKKVDVIVTPATPTTAFGINEKQINPVTMYLNDVFTVPVNLAGIPGLVLPVGLDNKKLPIGLQVLGNYFDEETIFKVAGIIEEAAGFNTIPDFLR